MNIFSQSKHIELILYIYINVFLEVVVLGSWALNPVLSFTCHHLLLGIAFKTEHKDLSQKLTYFENISGYY